MSLAPTELENCASKYAAEAIRLDSQGSRNNAIQAYQRAIDSLVIEWKVGLARRSLGEVG